MEEDWTLDLVVLHYIPLQSQDSDESSRWKDGRFKVKENIIFVGRQSDFQSLDEGDTSMKLDT